MMMEKQPLLHVEIDNECPVTRNGIHIDTIRKCFVCGHHHCAVCRVCIRCQCPRLRSANEQRLSDDKISSIINDWSEQMSNENEEAKTSAGDPIAPNRQNVRGGPVEDMLQDVVMPRAGAVNDMLTGVITMLDVSTSLAVNALSETVAAGGDIGSASLDRINQLKRQLLEELNKAQQRTI